MDLKQRFIAILEKSIDQWEDAAANCDSLVGIVQGQQGDVMTGRAGMYRERAKELRGLLEQVRKEK